MRELCLFARLGHGAEGRHDQRVALDVKSVRRVERIVGEPSLELSVLQAPDGIGRQVGDVDDAFAVARHIVEPFRARRGIALGDGLRGNVDLDELIDVGDIELAAIEREAGRRSLSRSASRARSSFRQVETLAMKPLPSFCQILPPILLT